MTDTVAAAKRVLLDRGEHLPQLCLDTDKGVLLVALMDMPDELAARAPYVFTATEHIRRGMTDAGRLYAVAFASEAWYAMVAPGAMERDDWVRPRDDAARKEALVVAARDVTDPARKPAVYFGEILRLGDAVIDLLPREDMVDGGEWRSSIVDAVIAGWPA